MTEQEIKMLANEVVKNLGSSMTLDLALALTEKVKSKAREMGVNAVVAVSNAAGNPLSVLCMDDSYLASYDFAFN